MNGPPGVQHSHTRTHLNSVKVFTFPRLSAAASCISALAKSRSNTPITQSTQAHAFFPISEFHGPPERPILSHSPDERNAGQNLQVSAAGGTVQRRDALDGQARGHIVTFRTVAEHVRGERVLLVVIQYTRGGQSGGGEQANGHDEHFHFRAVVVFVCVGVVVGVFVRCMGKPTIGGTHWWRCTCADAMWLVERSKLICTINSFSFSLLYEMPCVARARVCECVSVCSVIQRARARAHERFLC